MDLVTVAILTKNEERHMVDVVRNAKKLTNSVLIVDCGSTDKTVELAEQEGASVVFRAWDNDFSAQRNFALEHISTKYVLYLDADERMDDELIADIKKQLDNDTLAKYTFIEEACAFGYHFKHGMYGPARKLRLFPREHIKWVNKVHEHPVCDVPQKNLKGKVLHYTYINYQHWFNKMNLYTTIWAEDNYDKGKRISSLSPFLHSFFAFFRSYFFQLGFLDGWAGLYSSIQYGIYTLLKYLKLLEIQKNN